MQNATDDEQKENIPISGVSVAVEMTIMRTQ